MSLLNGRFQALGILEHSACGHLIQNNFNTKIPTASPLNYRHASEQDTRKQNCPGQIGLKENSTDLLVVL